MCFGQKQVLGYLCKQQKRFAIRFQVEEAPKS